MHTLETAQYFRFHCDAEGEHLKPCAKDDEGALKISLEQIPPRHVRTPLVSEADFDAALGSFPRSSTREELAQFSQWEKENR
jgi:hypothetical protein